MKSVLGATIASAGASFASFDTFAQSQGRVYERTSAEYAMRRVLYEQRVASAEAHNSQPERLWTAGVNKLSDWTDHETLALRGWVGAARPESSGRAVHRQSSFLEVNKKALPKEWIWSNLSSSKYIKDQGACGSCWAISASTVLEAHAEIVGRPRTFSTQQITECTPNPKHCGGTGGCQGATAELAMDWVLKFGCPEEHEMPYAAADGTGLDQNTQWHRCSFGGSQPTSLAQVQRRNAGAAFGMTGWETLPKNEYEPLIRALVERGPAAVSASAHAWQSYAFGIFNSCSKDAEVDHAVTLIGYGEEKGVKYWSIQNSWGSDWGENGRIRLQRHEEGYCGMNNAPQKGIACEGETDPVPVCGMCGVLFDSVVPHFEK